MHPLCLTCDDLFGSEPDAWWTCMAYPEAIFSGETDHFHHRKGDRGLRYRHEGDAGEDSYWRDVCVALQRYEEERQARSQRRRR